MVREESLEMECRADHPNRWLLQPGCERSSPGAQCLQSPTGACERMSAPRRLSGIRYWTHGGSKRES
eukprot:13998200-Alexandrium_andersonii.AAC.1